MIGRAVQVVVWLALAVTALYQIALLVEAIAGRVAYPYDLEWMEGGLLHHAERIRLGQGIYVPPSADFIPYLYTPLYPTLLALFGGPFGLSYTLGRAVSIVGLAGIAVTAVVSLADVRPRALGASLTGTALALGLFAACYPYVDGWYDLVRADTFFLFMITAAIAGLPHWATSDEGVVGHGKVAAGAAVMALAFFCKQTGILYVAFGGAIVVLANWRRAPTYVAMAGIIGLGGTWILNQSTRGQFWTYVSEIHREHDFNLSRFYDSFRNILWHFPAATVVIAATLVLVAITAWRRRLPPAARPFVLWTCAYALSTVVGAVSWGTEFAHFNAYLPALLHGALAAGAAVPAAFACGRALRGERRFGDAFAGVLGFAAALPLALTCATARWQPRDYIPTEADVLAGDRLIRHIRAIDGEVWVPFHSWYARLAGKTPYVHRMGIIDVTSRNKARRIERLDGLLRDHHFAAIIVDNRDLPGELPALAQFYHPAQMLPADERPHLYSGAGRIHASDPMAPSVIWVPTLPAPTPPVPAAPPPAPPQPP
ncbi:MAG: hypothetical protein E6J90_25335 [Deltaproteobacteria bacterium]|nr:MAG: hypothetical protein E6J90_25335 [Deltaproteobacteria bacterium]